MRATGEHHAAVPVPTPPPLPLPPADDVDKERRRRRRPARRPKQISPHAAAVAPSQGTVPDSAGPTPFSSMPALHSNGGCDAAGPPAAAAAAAAAGAAAAFRSCPLPSMSDPVELELRSSSRAVGKRCFEPHLPEQAVEEALKKGNAFAGKFRVNAHNPVEAYCTIDGLPVDVLITGAAQNRAVEGDFVAVTLDPVVCWNRMKGPSVPCNPKIGGDSVVRGAAETNENSICMKRQADASCTSENCSNGLPVLDTVHQYHKYSSFSQAVNCEDGCAAVREGYEEDCDGRETEAGRALRRISAMIYSHPSKRPTGKVLSIIKKSPRREAIVGFLSPFAEFPDGERQRNQISAQDAKRNTHRASSSSTGLIHLVPTDPKFPKMVVRFRTLLDDVRQRLKDGDASVNTELVAARIDGWDEGSLYPQAQIIQLLGKGGEIDTQIGAILFENAISAVEFSPESLACLPDMTWKIPQEELEARKDLRDILTFTIDPSTAVDLDDALSIETTSEGILRIGVHIADVSYFVHPETALDTEAQIRSTSVYILQHKVPMLPRRLSEGLVSLNPGVDKLAFSIIWDIDPYGKIVNRWIGRTVIFSCCRLSYDLVQDIIGDDSDQFSPSISTPQVHGKFAWVDVIKSLRCLYKVSKNLKKMRFKDGALSLETTKLMILFDEGGTPCDSYLHERNEACSIVEELMLLANRSAAEVISNAFPDCALLRRHPEPNLRKLREFEAFCARNGFELDASSSGQLHLSLSRIRQKLKDDPVLFDILISYASKPMQSAAYFCTGALRGKKDDWAHYALSVPLYTHFTSPLRRYPDIIVHRTLYAVLEAEEIYLKQKKDLIGSNKVTAASSEMISRCFTGMQFNKDATQSKEGREVLSVAAEKFKVPGSQNLGDVAEYCNERKWASRRAEEAGEKLYIWALLKRKEFIISKARVLGLGPRFMSIYLHKLAIERRVYYDEVEGLTAEWLETTGTLVLDVRRNKPLQRRGSPLKYRPIEEVAMVMNPSELTISEQVEEAGTTQVKCSASKLALLGDDAKAEVAPAVLPLVIQHLDDIPVTLHASGGDDGPVDIAVKLYISSYFK